MQEMDEQGRLYLPVKMTQRIQRKRFLDEFEGETVDSLWDDISPINSQAKERLGYPTQKPLALLKRVIEASSNEGDVVLDPFCGCGTSVRCGTATEEAMDRHRRDDPCCGPHRCQVAPPYGKGVRDSTKFSAYPVTGAGPRRCSSAHLSSSNAGA